MFTVLHRPDGITHRVTSTRHEIGDVFYLDHCHYVVVEITFQEMQIKGTKNPPAVFQNVQLALE